MYVACIYEHVVNRMWVICYTYFEQICTVYIHRTFVAILHSVQIHLKIYNARSQNNKNISKNTLQGPLNYAEKYRLENNKHSMHRLYCAFVVVVRWNICLLK